MRYQVLSATKVREYDTAYGKNAAYALTLADESGQTVTAEVGQKLTTPIPSGTIEGDIEQTQYGLKFKKAQQPYGGSAPTTHTKKDDPTTQRQIIRQNSLTNAVNYVLGKAQFMSKEEALKFVNGKEIIQVATYFAKYSEGEVTVVTEKEEPKEAPKQAVDWEARVAEATSNHPEEVDLSDVPF